MLVGLQGSKIWLGMLDDSEALPWVLADPVSRLLESRYWVLAPPELGRVIAVPMIRPEASRVTDCTVPPDCFWRSMVWTILPDESRTTSRQVSAGSRVARARGSTIGRNIVFMKPETESGGRSFDGKPLIYATFQHLSFSAFQHFF